MQIAPYLVFNGNAEQAANFYAQALSGKIEKLTRFNQFPPMSGWEVPADAGNLVGHCCIVFDGGSMSVADTLPSDKRDFGNGGHMITLTVKTVAEAEKVFGKLADGAQKVNCPLQKVFYAERYGELVDRFGVLWAVMACGE